MEFMEAVRARWACKLYDVGAALSPEVETGILEAGRLAPSSFGLEHWRFIAVRDDAVRFRLFGACLLQEGVRTAPLTVAILVRAARFYAMDSDFIKARSGRFPGGYQVFLDDYRGYHQNLEKVGALENWARSQAYLACMNMMNAAAAAGVASCAIEGFDEAAVLSILSDALPGFDPGDWLVGLLCTFGYPGEPRRDRIRADLEDIVTRI